MAAAIAPPVATGLANAQTATDLPSHPTPGAVADALLPRGATPGTVGSGFTVWILGAAWQRKHRPAERTLPSATLAALDSAATEALDMSIRRRPFTIRRVRNVRPGPRSAPATSALA